ncbi:MAG: uracil-DNA glycosylase [Pirellulales bacterium]|nr:uracil-DNA glycosylase [Pirellulales bacterium]
MAQTLESLQRAGVTHVSRRRGSSSAASPPPPAEPATAKTPPLAVAGKPAATPPPKVESAPVPPATTLAKRSADLLAAQDPAVPALSRAERVSALQVIQQEVKGCVRCHELATTRTQTVFGVGNPEARLVFCGEAPGADEDRQGEPFVGRAGQLLNKIIEACTLRREDVFILNVLKCRPPGNRNPAPDEVAHCRGYLDRQLSIIRPEFICCLGSIAAQTLLETNVSIGKLRKKFHAYEGIPVLVTYHPAYLLRNPAAKRDVWEDMQVLMKEMGIELPK